MDSNDERIDLDGDDQGDNLVEDDEVLIEAPTQEEADESRSAWQDEVADAAQQPQGESFEQYKARVREELHGMGLAWWEDNSLTGGLGVLGKVLDSVVDTTESIQTMYDVGLPQETMLTDVPVSLISGPLILSALQVLGLFEPRLRDQIQAVMRTFSANMPEPTEAEQQALEEAAEKASERLFAGFVKDIEAVGGQVMTPEQFRDELIGKDESADNGSALN